MAEDARSCGAGRHVHPIAVKQHGPSSIQQYHAGSPGVACPRRDRVTPSAAARSRASGASTPAVPGSPRGGSAAADGAGPRAVFSSFSCASCSQSSPRMFKEYLYTHSCSKMLSQAAYTAGAPDRAIQTSAH